MKKILSLTCLLLTLALILPAIPAISSPQTLVEIGSETKLDYFIPMDPGWGSTYSQTIYKQSDINTANQRITKISYHYVHIGDPIDPFTDSIKIFMGHTSANTLEPSWIPLTEMVEVYNGTITCHGAGDEWIELNLTFPFAYNNVDNLVVSFYEYTPGLRGWNDYFYCSESSEVMSLRLRSDEFIDINNPQTPVSYGHLAAYPNIILQFEDLPSYPVIVTIPSPVDFGYLQINHEDSTEVRFLNFGGVPLQITGVTGISAPFSMDPPVITVAPGAQSGPFTIYFNPASAGIHNQTITFTSNSTGGIDELDLHGYCFADPYIDEFPYVMGFEGNDDIFPAYGWTNDGAIYDWDELKEWSRGFIPVSGAYSAGVLMHPAGEAVMVTPYINLPESYRISFWWADNDNELEESAGSKDPKIIGQDTTFFEASLDHGLTWDTLVYLSALQPEQWHKQYVGLAGFASDSLLLRWRDVTNGDYYAGRGIALDEIIIEYNNPVPEIALNNDTWDAGIVLVDDIKESGLVYTLTNTEGGTLTVSSISDLVGTEFTTTLIPEEVSLGLGESYNFGFSYSPLEIGADNAVFEIVTNGGTVWVALSGEGATIGEFSSEGFDGGTFPPLGWVIVDADEDGFNWMQHYNQPEFPTHSGIGSAYSESYSPIGGILFPDNYLISPLFTVTNEKNVFVWYACSASESPFFIMEHYSVSISNGSTDPADFTELFNETIDYQGWTERTVNLNDYMGQEARIAIRHYWSTDKFQLMIDDVAVIPESSVAVSEFDAEWQISIYPNPASDVVNIASRDMINKISVYNIFGALIKDQEVNAVNARVDISNLAEGLYILKFETKRGMITSRLNVAR
jgi:hypothetical protein